MEVDGIISNPFLVVVDGLQHEMTSKSKREEDQHSTEGQGGNGSLY